MKNYSLRIDRSIVPVFASLMPAIMFIVPSASVSYVGPPRIVGLRASSFVFVQTYHTPTIPGVIISHSAISRQLNTSSYHTSSHLDAAGFIHFPHRLRCKQDVYVSIQPISKLGGLAFTEALILPDNEQHLAAIPPWPTCVHRLCSDHASDILTPHVINPIDGMTCKACHEPPVISDGTSCHSCHDQRFTPDFW
jgi:hypothetical protein